MPYEKQEKILKDAIQSENAGIDFQMELSAKWPSSISWLALEEWNDAKEGYEKIVKWRHSLPTSLNQKENEKQKQLFSQAVLGLARLEKINTQFSALEELPITFIHEVEANCASKIASICYKIGETAEKTTNTQKARRYYALAYQFYPNNNKIFISHKKTELEEKLHALSLGNDSATSEEYQNLLFLADEILAKEHPNQTNQSYLNWLQAITSLSEKSAERKDKQEIDRKIREFCKKKLNGIVRSASAENLLAFSLLLKRNGHQWHSMHETKKMRVYYEDAITCASFYIEHEKSDARWTGYDYIAKLSNLLFQQDGEKFSDLDVHIEWLEKIIALKEEAPFTYKQVVYDAEALLARAYFKQNFKSDKTFNAFKVMTENSELYASLFPHKEIHLTMAQLYIQRGCYDDAEKHCHTAGKAAEKDEDIDKIFEQITSFKEKKLKHTNTVLIMLFHLTQNFEKEKKRIDLNFHKEKLEERIPLYRANPSLHDVLVKWSCLIGHLCLLFKKNTEAAEQYAVAFDLAAEYRKKNDLRRSFKILSDVMKNSLESSNPYKKAKILSSEILKEIQAEKSQKESKIYTGQTSSTLFGYQPEPSNGAAPSFIQNSQIV